MRLILDIPPVNASECVVIYAFVAASHDAVDGKFKFNSRSICCALVWTWKTICPHHHPGLFFFCFEKWRDKWWTWSGDMKELLRAWSFYDHREKLTGWCRLLLPFPNFSFNFFEFSSFRPKIKTQDSLEYHFFFSHLIILAVELQSWRTIGVFCIVANKQTRKLWPIFTSDTRNCVFSTDKELNELTEWIPSAKTEYCAH